MLIFLMAQYVHGRREPSVNRCIDPPPQIKIILAESYPYYRHVVVEIEMDAPAHEPMKP